MKIRKTTAVHTAAAIALSAAFLLAGCKTDISKNAEADAAEEETITNQRLAEENTINEEENAINEKKNAINEENKDTESLIRNDAAGSQKASAEKTDIYDSVLAQYSDMVQNDFYADLRDSDAYYSSFGEDIGLEICLHKQDIYYAFYDIDGNGTMELIIAGGERAVSEPVFTPWNYDLYGYNGTHIVSIFPEMEFGGRTNFSLCENGVIKVFYSSSAAESGVDFYRIGSDGVTPERIDSYTAVGHLEDDKPVFAYFQNGNEITEEEYHSGIQNYEAALTSLNWIQIQ